LFGGRKAYDIALALMEAGDRGDLATPDGLSQAERLIGELNREAVRIISTLTRLLEPLQE
jgi:hypothetical protein